jgi:hypothetical protein
MATTLRPAFSPDSFRANWRRRDSFVWWAQPDDADEFGLWVLSHRDSGLIDQSNGAVIRKRLAQHEASGDVIFFGCSHWLVGSTEEMAVRVYVPGTRQTTAAFEALAEMVEACEGYPILDESDYSDREYASALEGIEVMAAGEIDLPDGLPADWKDEVYSWLSDNEPTELENTDDRGAFPSADSIGRALVALSIISHDHA